MAQDKTATIKSEEIKALAADHVDWFLEMVRPLMITEFEHGFEHGFKHGVDVANSHYNGGDYGKLKL